MQKEEDNLTYRRPASYQREFLHMRRGDSGEKLMQEEAEEESQQRGSWEPASGMDARQEEEYKQSYCFPIFLSSIGQLCIPFQVCCHCQQVCSYTCQSPLYQQPTGSAGLLQQWGGFTHVLPAGLHILNPISQSVITLSLQTKTLEFIQVGNSKENIQMELKMVIFYRVVDGMKLAYRLGSSAEECIVSIASAGMRGLLGQNLFQIVVQNPSKLTNQLKEETNNQLQRWGLYVEMICVKDLTISEELAISMEQVAMQKRANESMLIDFQADVEVGGLIKEMSEIMNTRSSFQIRYLKAIEHILENGGENVIILRAKQN